MREALAWPAVYGIAAARARAGGRLLRARVASGRSGGDEFAGDDARLARASQAQAGSARAAAAAPVLAQQCLAQRQSLVREGASAGAPTPGAAAFVKNPLALSRIIIYLS